MKTKLNRIIERLKQLQDETADDELIDEIENAIIHLDAAHDRIVQMEEEEEEEGEEEEDRLSPIERDAAIQFANELLEALGEEEEDRL